MYTDTTDTNPIIDSVYFLVLDYRPFLIYVISKSIYNIQTVLVWGL